MKAHVSATVKCRRLTLIGYESSEMVAVLYGRRFQGIAGVQHAEPAFAESAFDWAQQRRHDKTGLATGVYVRTAKRQYGRSPIRNGRNGIERSDVEMEFASQAKQSTTRRNEGRANAMKFAAVFHTAKRCT